MQERTNTAKWSEKEQRWRISIQRDGKRKVFTSSIPGRAGQRDANRKADEWANSGVDYNATVESLYEKWILKAKELSSYGYYCELESKGRIWILPHIGHKKIQKVTEQDLQDILDDAYKKGKADKTIKNLKSTMLAFFKYCRKSNATTLLPENLTIGKNAPKSQKKILVLDDIKKLFSEPLEDYWYLNAYRFIFLTGIREGELKGIKKTDIKNGLCVIDRSINKFGEITNGKTENAKRTFVITEPLQKIITAQLNQIMLMDSEYLFPSCHGQPSSHSTIYNQWKRFQKNEDMKSNISIHELRHTFISYCKGIPLEYLKMQVGHSASMDTFGQYGHQTENDLQIVSQLISEKIHPLIQ